MHSPRSGGSRSKSRSPLPPSPRPSTFLPPSHYAEAGGLVPRPPARVDHGKTKDSKYVHVNTSPVSEQTQASGTSMEREFPRNSVFMPIASKDSDSSFEFGSRSRPLEPQNRRFSMAIPCGGTRGSGPGNSRGRGGVTNVKSGSRVGREGQMMNLPQVETHLLPSLRDTIDRMTRTPASKLEVETLSRQDSVASHDSRVTPATSPHPAGSTTPKALKSALRAPTPKLQLAPRPPKVHTPTTRSSDKFERMGSTPSECAPLDNQVQPKRDRQRSKTDPGTMNQLSSIPRIHAPQTPVPGHRSKFHPDGSSSIPRPKGCRTVHSTPRPACSQQLGEESSSDLELRYEIEARDRRSLRVTNGTGAPITSSSESELSEPEPAVPVGLGLGLDDPSFGSRFTTSQLRPRSNGLNAPDRYGEDPAERRRRELIGIVQNLEHQYVQDYGVVNQQHYGKPDPPWCERSRNTKPPLVMVSSSSSQDNHIHQQDVPATWRRSKSSSPVPHSAPQSKRQSRERKNSNTPSPALRSSERPSRDADSGFNDMYHRSSRAGAQPHQQSPESVYDEPQDWHAGAGVPERLQPAHRIMRDSDILANSDAVRLALKSRYEEAKEREVLGLPPSESCEARNQRLSYMDSGSSLARVGKAQWEEVGRAGHLSMGAEKLFRTLSGRRIDPTRDGWTQQNVAPAALTPSSSASSVYDDDDVPLSQSDPDASGRRSAAAQIAQSWRSIHQSPEGQENSPPDAMESERQDIIHELFTTEEAFVTRLANTIDLFVLPLRMQDSKSYVSGVPPEIGRLFDWLEDIYNLHNQFLLVLRRTLETTYPVQCIGDCVQDSLIVRLEVYQPYLARLVPVAAKIAEFVAQAASDFGEFVRLQESVEGCRGDSLEGLLAEPVTRLAHYTTLFRSILEVTPKTHPDYLATFVLVHMTELMIKAMTQVKLQEDDYDTMKAALHGISNLPPSFDLVNRSRRLLHHGQLVQLQEDSTQNRKNARGRSSKLVDAIHVWDERKSRSSSFKSAETMGTASTEPVSPYLSVRHHDQEGGLKISTKNQHEEVANVLQVFVFSDCVLITKLHGRHDWRPIEDVGLAKVMGLSEDEKNAVLSLDVMTSNQDRVKTLRLGVARTSDATFRDAWIPALQESLKSSILSLSVPKAYVANVEPSHKPMFPKSPSLICQQSGPKDTNHQNQEREERGWWSSRFQQVLKQLQAGL